jgi:hypothetical protein
MLTLQIRALIKFCLNRRALAAAACATGALFPATTFATTAVVSNIINASNFEGVPSSGVTIYGGVAGSDSEGTCAVRDNNATCDNCSSALTGDAGLKACNNYRIYPSLRLFITVKSDKIDGVPIITSADGNNKLQVEIDSAASATKGTPVNVIVQWSQICAALDPQGVNGGANCDPVNGTLSGTLRVGIDATPYDNILGSSDDYATLNIKIQSDIGQDTATQISLGDNCANSQTVGLCFFDLGAGDGKAFVRGMKALNGFPNAAGNIFKYVRFYWSETGFTEITPGSPDHVDLEISGSGSDVSVSPKRIEGLQNDHTYYFKAAIVDMARNVGYFTPAADDAYCEYSTTNPSDCHVVTPGEVVGILSKSPDCFIATAAYGSSMAPQVEIFRQFRNTFLLKTDLGTSFVRFYYRHSPHFAAIIAESETLRAFSRVALWPLALYARASLELGATTASMLFATVLMLPLLAIQYLRRRPRRAPVRDARASGGRREGASRE